MSQVRKFSSGGVPARSLFDAAGRNIDKEDLIYFAKKNKDTLLNNYGLTGDEATSVSNAYDDLLANIDSGNISSMDINGGLIDNTSAIDASDSSYNTAAALIDQIVNRMSTAKAVTDTRKKYTDTNGLLDTLNKEFYGGQYEGSDSDLELWMNLDKKDKTGLYERKGRMNKLADMIDLYINDVNTKDYNYEGSNYKDKVEHLQKLATARDLLRKGDYNDDVIRALMALGIGSKQVGTLFTDGSTTEDDSDNSTDNSTDSSTDSSATDSSEKELAASKEAFIQKAMEPYAGQPENVKAKAREVAERAWERQQQAIVDNLEQTKKALDIEDFVAANPVEEAEYLINVPNYNYPSDDDDYWKSKEVNTARVNLISALSKKANYTVLDLLQGKDKGLYRTVFQQLLNMANGNQKYANSLGTIPLGKGQYWLSNYAHPEKDYGWVYVVSKGKAPVLKKVRFSSFYNKGFLNWWDSQHVKAHKKGGVLKFGDGGTTSGVRQQSAAGTWKTDVFDAYQDYILQKLDAGLANWLNQMQDKHYKMYSDANASGNWRDSAFLDPEVTEYQNDYGADPFYNVNGIGGHYSSRYDSKWNNKTRNNKDVLANLSDRSKWVDGAFSSITDDRRLLGRKEDWDPEQLEAFNKKLKDKGFKMVLHDNDYYYLEPLAQTNPKTITPSIKPLDLKEKPYVDVDKLKADQLRIQNLIDSALTNKKIIDLYKSKEPILKDPNSQVAPTDVTSATIRAQGTQAAEEIMDEGRRIQNSTSSGLLGRGYRLDAIRQAEETKDKHNTAAQEYVQKYADARVPVVNYNKQQEVETGNYNNAALVAKANQDKEYDAALLSNDYSTVRAPYRNELILEAKTDAATNKAKHEQAVEVQRKQTLQNALINDPRYLTASALAAQYKTDNNATAYKETVNYLKQLQNEYITQYYNASYNLNMPVIKPLNFDMYGAPSQIVSNKNGGTLKDNMFKARLKDNERFDKSIQKMIEENQKAINNSSAITKAIITKLMSKF